jgi:hypothetical protein
MKTIKRELAHVGMFGPDGVTITRKHLEDCAQTFDGKCPATLGHRLADWMPKFGNVKAVELQNDGDSLVGDVEVNDLLADAVDAKFYEDVSVGIQKRKSDGKYYLHHLAFLGAVPPKIRDLKVFDDLGVVHCGEDEDVIMFASSPADPDQAAVAPDEISKALQRIADKGRSGWPLHDALEALEELTAWATEMLLSGAKIPDSLREQVQAFADQITQAGEAGKEENVLQMKEELEAANAKLEANKKELADAKATILASVKETLRSAMKGRIPVAKQNLVLALADQLVDVGPIDLADTEDATKTTKTSALEILRRVLESIPLPVVEGREDLGDLPAEDAKRATIPFEKA